MVLYRAAGLLTLDNKMQWLQRKVQQFKRDLQSMAQVVSFEVAREDVFLSFWASATHILLSLSTIVATYSSTRESNSFETASALRDS